MDINQHGNAQHTHERSIDPTDADIGNQLDDLDSDNLGLGNTEDQLARSLKLLAKKIDKMPTNTASRNTIKPRSPNTFDGSDPAKLETFIFQISMYIAARSKDFPDDESQVTFAMSYLKGTPLEWFQTEVNEAMRGNGRFPDWFKSYPSFVAELNDLFGPRDPITDAMTALESLKYKDSTKATQYTVDFNRHAQRTGWNDQALTRQYYKGLPDRLKDEMARVGRPTQLKHMQQVVSVLDQRHWERQSEITRNKKSSNTSPNNTNHRTTASDNRPDKRGSSSQASDSKPSNQQDKQKDQKKSNNNNNNKTSSSSSSKPANSIADLLGPDGKLRPEERQRRMDNNLCLHCGKKGHTVSDCPVTSKAKPKGRAANATSSNAATAAPASGSSRSGKA